PQAVPMTVDTLFDMASLTKPVATATSIMKLLEDGRLRLGDRVVTFFPEFAPHGKDEITIHDLLVHQSGLIPDNALRDYQQGPQEAWQRICELELVAPVGTAFKYSDVNFIVLAELVKKLSGKSVHDYSQQHIFQPLGMSETGYLPSAELKLRAAPTEQRDGQWIRGEVHDPRAFLLGGVAGHAGLFSTATDMAIYAQMMLQSGTYRPANLPPVPVLSPQTVATMTQGYPVSSGIRGLGWDKQTGFSSNKGDLLSDAAFGHGGFTGTVMWVDPQLDLFFIFLSNRVHPSGNGSVNHLAGRLVNVLASSAAPERPEQAIPKAVLTGIDVLQRDAFAALKDQRVGLISNHTGRDQAGTSTVQILYDSPQVKLTTLFSPEHGFEGKLDIAKIDDSREESTGLKIYSLYGATRRPTKDMLAEVDTLVFDIQDIGTRFYTYISTMGEAMQAAAEADKRFVVLDRPNPINGVDVAGPMLDPGQESFVAFHRLPVRHGMTTGELARMLQAELKLDLDLKIIACEGWQRASYWEQSGLTWVNPSPNMRSLTQALLYPGIGLLETTNLSVGRGTDTPFEVLGAPWIDGRQLAAELNARQLPGVVFIPIEFTPDSSKFADELCQGIHIAIIDRQAFEPLEVGLSIAAELRRQYPEQWSTKSLNRLLGNAAVLEDILQGRGIAQIMRSAAAGVPDFLVRRAPYLLYR
ncbi:MAG: DUF1343 domain-containing protein, partial [Planctomycetales bacterium]|nr:DUF1343 domain-containing protein [Planctomycetales bacterium]